MNEHTIGTPWAEDNRIGTRLAPREDHVLRKPRPVRFEYLTYGLAEKIGADFSYQAGGDSQLVQSQPCIGDRAARREDDRPCFDGLPGPEEDVASRQRWEHVQADMPGHHGFAHTSFLLTFQRYDLGQAVGDQCGGQDAVALRGFPRRHARETLAHSAGVSKLVAKGGPHLQDRIGEAKLEK